MQKFCAIAEHLSFWKYSKKREIGGASQFEKGNSTEDRPTRRSFRNQTEDVSDGQGNIIQMPVTYKKNLTTLIHEVCEKKVLDAEISN